MTNNNTPVNLAAGTGNRWTTPTGQVAGFEATTPAWGVMNADGMLLTRDGHTPSVWATKAIVTEHIAPNADGFAEHTFSLPLA
jgi:hypothetical protein